MSSVTIDFDRSAEVLALIEGAALAATERSAEVLVAKLRGKLFQSKSGREYHSKSKPSPHIASARGESPAAWSPEGGLADAIKHEAIPGGQEVFVSDEASYAARFLEEGSPGGKIAPRPWFWPTRDEHEPEFVAEVDAAVKAVTA